LGCLDKIIEYSGSISLRVILSRSSSKADAANSESSWYLVGDKYYTEKRYIADWAMLAARYTGTAVIAADLWNGPKGTATWGTGNTATDWNLAAERVGNAILTANKHWLVIVQGLLHGSDLTGVATAPVRLTIPQRVVYGVAEYSNDLYNKTYFYSPLFPNNLRTVWNTNFGFVVLKQIAPLFVSEFGTSFSDSKDSLWLETWLNYLNGQYLVNGKSELPPGHVGVSWSYQQVSPYGPVGGVLADDWQTVQSSKTTPLQAVMAPLFPFVTPGKFVPPVNVTSVVPFPTVPPTAAPTRPIFEYFHTSGNQIVNRFGKAVRLSGVNWYAYPLLALSLSLHAFCPVVLIMSGN
jgi:aryl-phospho-beta-D-glucosidase BglC (GH1 family)